MRRQDRAMAGPESLRLLQDGEYGVLSTVDEYGQPYGVPLNYVYMNDSIYFHCAMVGHKLNNILVNEKVSFCVVGRTEVLPSEFSTGFEGVLAFGTASAVEGEERSQALLGLAGKYCADYLDEAPAYIEKFDKQTKVVRFQVKQITGKAKITGNM